MDCGALGVAYLSLAAHKLGGPKGVGALVIRDGAALPALIAGGGQERRRRAGTENVSAIAGFGVAEGRIANPNFTFLAIVSALVGAGLLMTTRAGESERTFGLTLSTYGAFALAFGLSFTVAGFLRVPNLGLPHLVHRLADIADQVKFIKHHLGIATVLGHAPLIGPAHIHADLRDGMPMSIVLFQYFRKPHPRLPVPAFGGKEDTLGRSIGKHTDVFLALAHIHIIDPNTTKRTEVRLGISRLHLPEA